MKSGDCGGGGGGGGGGEIWRKELGAGSGEWGERRGVFRPELAVEGSYEPQRDWTFNLRLLITFSGWNFAKLQKPTIR